MSLTSFFANKCLEYFLKEDADISRNCKDKQQPDLFPPWASNLKAFKDFCTGCGKCAAACEDNLIIFKENELPVIDFSQGQCSFCGNCARSCPSGALHFSPDLPPWHLHVFINENCLVQKKVLCQLCQEQCEQEAIIFSQVGLSMQLPEILNDQCNGCGACLAQCPADAISFQQIDARQSEAVQRGN